MYSLPEYPACSKALTETYLHRLPAVPPERIALVWLTNRFRFASPELARMVAALAFNDGGQHG
jgi:hypothetical protein